MNGPLISVITVVYNAANKLEKTILSVTGQHYPNIEYIIIDGGSTDGTLDIIRKYQSKITYWESAPDNGVYDAMNKGVKKATGQWVYFLGAGDVLYSVIDRVAERLVGPNTIYYGDVYREDTKTLYDGRFSPFKLAVSNICHQSIFYPESVFSKYAYDTRYKIQADHVLNMQCHGDKHYRFEYMPLTICIYEGDGYSATALDKPFFADKIKLVKNNFSLPVYLYALARRIIARILKKPAYR